MEREILKNLKNFVKHFIKEEPQKGTYKLTLKLDELTYNAINFLISESFPQLLVKIFTGNTWSETGFRLFLLFASLIWSSASLVVGAAILSENIDKTLHSFEYLRNFFEFLMAIGNLIFSILFLILGGFGVHLLLLLATLLVVYLIFRTFQGSFFNTLLNMVAILLGELLLTALFFEKNPPSVKPYAPYLFLGSAIAIYLLLSFPPHLLKKQKKDVYQELLLWLAFGNTLKEILKDSKEPKGGFLKKLVPYAVALNLYPERFEDYKKASDFIDLLERVERAYLERKNKKGMKITIKFGA